MLTFIPSKSPGGIAERPIGQMTITGSQQFVVPDGVTSVCAVCVAPGGKNGSTANNRAGGGGGGGGLVWANNIQVQPGDVLDVVVGLGSQVTAVYNVESLIVSSISKNGVVLISSMSGRHGGAGTLAAGAGRGGVGGTFSVHPSITEYGGGIGGTGGVGGLSTSGNSPSCGGGGGAAGYAGSGGTGGRGGIGNTNSASKGTVGKGGGGGGGWPSDGSISYAAGGGVGLQGQGADGLIPSDDSRDGFPGSAPGPFFGAGLTTGRNTGADGAVRILWGNFRAFPATDTKDK